MKRYLWIGGALLLLLAGGYILFGQGGKGTPELRTATVTKGEVVLAVSAAGTVEPAFTVEIKSKASGAILSFAKEPGDRVATGEELVRLDPTTEQRNLDRAKADRDAAAAAVMSARATLAERKAKRDRAESLREKKVISAQEAEEAGAAFLSAQAHVAEAEAAAEKAAIAVADARERLSETVISSPLSGMVLEKMVQPGQIIASGISSFTGGTPLAKVADTSTMFVMAQVDETDIGRVRLGQEARIAVDAHRERLFAGRVVRIYPMGTAENDIIVFRVKVAVEDPDRELLLPAMSANVDLVAEAAPGVLSVPAEAIAEEGAKRYVTVLADGRRQRREVTTGLTNGFETVIVTGLAEGEEVVLSSPTMPTGR